MGPSWSQSGSILGLFWGHSGGMLGSFWAFLGFASHTHSKGTLLPETSTLVQEPLSLEGALAHFGDMNDVGNGHSDALGKRDHTAKREESTSRSACCRRQARERSQAHTLALKNEKSKEDSSF